MLPPLLAWLLLPLLTADEPLLEAVELEVLGVAAAAELLALLVPDEFELLLPDEREDEVPDELLPVVVPVALFDAWVAWAACSTRIPNPARLAAITPPTATLMRVLSGVRVRPLLFMPLRCRSDFWEPYDAPVRSL